MVRLKLPLFKPFFDVQKQTGKKALKFPARQTNQVNKLVDIFRSVSHSENLFNSIPFIVISIWWKQFSDLLNTFRLFLLLVYTQLVPFVEVFLHSLFKNCTSLLFSFNKSLPDNIINKRPFKPISRQFPAVDFFLKIAVNRYKLGTFCLCTVNRIYGRVLLGSGSHTSFRACVRIAVVLTRKVLRVIYDELAINQRVVSLCR